MSDAQTRLGILSKDQNYLVQAKRNAATAVALSPKGEFRGAAYAAFGDLSQKTGDYQVAIEAYSSAAQNGYRTDWVEGNYDSAFRMRDNVRVANSAVGYVELGKYQALDSTRLKAYMVPGRWENFVVK